MHRSTERIITTHDGSALAEGARIPTTRLWS
jgi:hypothetical protein